MKLLSVELQLFRQHAATTVEIPDGLTGIVGYNGSGKTTLVEAIGFALFGSKALRGKIEDVRTRSGMVRGAAVLRRSDETTEKGSGHRRKQGNETKVILLLEQDGVVFRIERSLTDAALFVGGEAQAVATGNRDVTNRISSIVGMSYDEFIATYFTEQKGLEFLSGKKGATEREKFIVRMMGYDRLEEMQDMLREDRKEKRATLLGYEASIGSREELESRLLAEKNEVTMYREKHDEAAQTLTRVEKECEYHKLRLSKLEEVKGAYLKQREVVNALGIRIDERERRLATLADEISRITAEIEIFNKDLGGAKSISEQRDILKDEAFSLEERSQQLQGEIREREMVWREGISAAEAELTGILKANETLEKRLQHVKKLRSDGECPTCGQPLADSFEKTQEHFRDELAQGSLRIKELQVRIAERKVLPFEVVVRIDELKIVEQNLVSSAQKLQALEKGQKLQERLSHFQFEQQSVQSDKTQCETAYASAQTVLAEIRFSEDEYGTCKGSFDAASRVVEVARLQRVKLEGELNTKSVLVQRTESELRKYDDRQIELEKLRKEVRILDEGDRILTEFRKYINSLIRPRLAELASEYLADLTDGRYTALELGDDFSPTVLEDGEPKPIISGGEQDILNLCMRLSLSHMLAERAGQQFSLLILDEIFGSLDEGRRNNVLNLLEKLRKRFEQILVITHLDDVKEGVQRLIEVEYDEESGAAKVAESTRVEWNEGGVASNF